MEDACNDTQFCSNNLQGEIIEYWDHTENVGLSFTYFWATDQVAAFLIRKKILTEKVSSEY